MRFSILLVAGLLLATPARTEAKKLTLNRTNDGVKAVIVVDEQQPHAGAATKFHVHLTHTVVDPKTKKRTTEPVSDATVVAHVGHGSDAENKTLDADRAEAGAYAGSITFDHPGTETMHVGVTVPGKKEWLIRLALEVHAVPKK